MAMGLGNAIIGQSGGPTAAINATLAGAISAFLSSELGQTGVLYGMRNGVEGLLRDDLVDLTACFTSTGTGTSRKIDEDKLNLLIQTPSAALGSCRKKLADPEKDPAVFEQMIALFRKYDIRYFFYIGGNDSMDTVSKLSRYFEICGYKMCCIGIPKTIDNDLRGTDHTPGYGSAAKFVAVTMQEILRDSSVYRTPNVIITEIMGRDAGWLTASAGVLKRISDLSPDLIYLPERTFDLDRFEADVRALLAVKSCVSVAVSEGARLADGHYVGEGAQSGAVDVFGHKYLAGVGKTLEQLVKDRIGCKVRSVELNVCQRCAAHVASQTDLRESRETGAFAVIAALSGETGVMVACERASGDAYTLSYRTRPVSEVAAQVRCVPDEYINADGNGITEACIDYVYPLIQGEPEVRYQNGIPVQLVL